VRWRPSRRRGAAELLSSSSCICCSDTLLQKRTGCNRRRRWCSTAFGHRGLHRPHSSQAASNTISRPVQPAWARQRHTATTCPVWRPSPRQGLVPRFQTRQHEDRAGSFGNHAMLPKHDAGTGGRLPQVNRNQRLFETWAWERTGAGRRLVPDTGASLGVGSGTAGVACAAATSQRRSQPESACNAILTTQKRLQPEKALKRCWPKRRGTALQQSALQGLSTAAVRLWPGVSHSLGGGPVGRTCGLSGGLYGVLFWTGVRAFVDGGRSPCNVLTAEQMTPAHFSLRPACDRRALIVSTTLTQLDIEQP